MKIISRLAPGEAFSDDLRSDLRFDASRGRGKKPTKPSARRRAEMERQDYYCWEWYFKMREEAV